MGSVKESNKWFELMGVRSMGEGGRFLGESISDRSIETQKPFEVMQVQVI